MYVEFFLKNPQNCIKLLATDKRVKKSNKSVKKSKDVKEKLNNDSKVEGDQTVSDELIDPDKVKPEILEGN